MNLENEKQAPNAFAELFGAETPSALVDALEPDRKIDKVKNAESKFGKLFFQASVLIFILICGFFYTQNSASINFFGANPAKKSLESEEQVKNLEADLVVRKHLTAILLLDRLIEIGDAHLYAVEQANSSFTSENKKLEWNAEAEESKSEIDQLLQKTKALLVDELDANEIVFVKSKIDTLILELDAKRSELDEMTLNQEISDLESAKMLLQNKPIKADIAQIHQNEWSLENLEALIQKYNTLSESKMALLAEIKNSRMQWSEVYAEIERVTKSVDPLFGTEFEGNISLTGISFEASGRIIITGGTSTDDSKNFTLIANLIDAYEASPMFVDVQNRDFVKSPSSEGDSHESGFRISVTLSQP